MAEFWVFWILAPISLGSAIAMILMRNAVHSALMLVLNFFTLAAFYAVLEAQFLAVVQIIVYAGAIMVLFLFVLMLLGIARDEPLGSPVRGQKAGAVVLGLLLLAGLSVGVAGPFMGAEAVCGAEATEPAEPAGDGPACAGLAEVNAAEGGNIRQVGLRLFTDYVWPFEVMSVLLVIAALGAMVLGRRREDPSELVDGPRETGAVAVRAPLRSPAPDEEETR
ncbi:MAG: NADH-quinone oxidoreductase subunit J [Egibacteraceae bacterium]